MSFHFRRLGRLGNQIGIPIPKDEHGYLGRECPETGCEGYFKIKPGTGLDGADLPCHCPYCGHSAPVDHFWTKEQLEYAESAALRQITDAARADLKALEFNIRPKGGFGVGLRMKVQPGRPVPIRRYREKDLETTVTCDACALEYAVFGVFGFCPDCRQHNSFAILMCNLALIRKQLALADTLRDLALRQHIIEDALENCVSSFDGLGARPVLSEVHKALTSPRPLQCRFRTCREHQSTSKCFLVSIFRLRSLQIPGGWLMRVS